MKILPVVSLILAVATPVFAQDAAKPAEIRQTNPRITTPGTSGGTVVNPGGADNGGTGSVGTIAPGATGADSISNNSAAAGNAQQNQRPVGNSGGGESGGQ